MKVVTATGVALRSRKRILLVEDDSDLARLYRGVLRIAGFDALHVADGWSALRAIDEEPPDLIVSSSSISICQVCGATSC